MFRLRRTRPGPAQRPRACRWCDGEEPRLDELLADPLVHLVMERDRIGPDDVQAVIRVIRSHRGGATAPA